MNAQDERDQVAGSVHAEGDKQEQDKMRLDLAAG